MISSIDIELFNVLFVPPAIPSHVFSPCVHYNLDTQRIIILCSDMTLLCIISVLRNEQYHVFMSKLISKFCDCYCCEVEWLLIIGECVTMERKINEMKDLPPYGELCTKNTRQWAPVAKDWVNQLDKWKRPFLLLLWFS